MKSQLTVMVSKVGSLQVGKVILAMGITTLTAVLDDTTALQAFSATSLTDRHGWCIVVCCLDRESGKVSSRYTVQLPKPQNTNLKTVALSNGWLLHQM